MFLIKLKIWKQCPDHLLLGATLKENKPAVPIKAAIPYQIKLGEVKTNIEYKLLNMIGEIIRVSESNTPIAPNNWPIWDGATKLVCNDFIVGLDTEPNEAITAAVLKFQKLERWR